MNVVFMDIDGVLNNLQTFRANKDNSALDSNNIKVFNEIIEKSGAKVVISSSWRAGYFIEDLKKLLYDAGLRADIIGETPVWKEANGVIITAYDNRGQEIQAWLDEHKDVESYIIIDDNDDMPEFYMHQRLVKTDFETGLLPEHVFIALHLLENKLE